MKTLQTKSNKTVYVFHTNSLEESHVKGDNDAIRRYQYQNHYHTIDNTRKLKALVREGQYSFPGGYAVIPYTSDGSCLCVDCIKDNLSSVLWSIRNNVSDGWKVVGLDVYYGVKDNGETVCDNCGKDWENI